MVNLRDTLLLTDGGQILNLAVGAGNAGNIPIVADSLRLAGINRVPTRSASTIETVAPAAIDTQPRGRGKAGDISIQATSLQVVDGASLDARTLGVGSGGNI